jgi:hypothetical protein
VIRRVYDASEIDYLLNDPMIRPTIGGDGPLSVHELIADERNVFLVEGDNGAAFLWRGPGVFEGHSFFKARGREAIGIGARMLESMAGQASLVWGATPVSLRHVRWFNRQIGFRSLGLIDTPDAGRCELFEKRF